MQDLVERRRAAMALCADATLDELQAALGQAGHRGGEVDLRPAETGLVMARGRVGGDGARFNMGEVTVTRAAVRLPGGEVGHAYHMGRDPVRARAAATLDALWQTGQRSLVEDALAPVATRLAAARAQQARRTAATKVDFFTLVRGED